MDDDLKALLDDIHRRLERVELILVAQSAKNRAIVDKKIDEIKAEVTEFYRNKHEG